MRRLTLCSLLVLLTASPASADGLFGIRGRMAERRHARQPATPAAVYAARYATYPAPIDRLNAAVANTPPAPAPGGHWAYQRMNCQSGQCQVQRVWVAN